MIETIFNLRTIKGTGRILCDIDVGAGGCDEDLKTTISGTDYVGHAKHSDAGTYTDEEILHKESGTHAVVVKAAASGVSSNPKVLEL